MKSKSTVSDEDGDDSNDNSIRDKCQIEVTSNDFGHEHLIQAKSKIIALENNLSVWIINFLLFDN